MKELLVPALLMLCITAFAQKQGVSGQVFWVTGNQMPGPGRSNAAQPVVREIYFYKAVKLDGAKQANGLFTKIHGTPVAKTCSRNDGTFKVKLPPGKYSVFIKEPDGLFANSFDEVGHINPVIVNTNKFSQLTIHINYTAVY